MLHFLVAQVFEQHFLVQLNCIEEETFVNKKLDIQHLLKCSTCFPSDISVEILFKWHTRAVLKMAYGSYEIPINSVRNIRLRFQQCRSLYYYQKSNRKSFLFIFLGQLDTNDTISNFILSEIEVDQTWLFFIHSVSVTTHNKYIENAAMCVSLGVSNQGTWQCARNDVLIQVSQQKRITFCVFFLVNSTQIRVIPTLFGLLTVLCGSVHISYK